jgi:hypothetical protein
MTEQAQVFGLIAALRAYGDGKEPTPIKLVSDLGEPIFIVRHNGQSNYLYHVLKINERFHAGQIGEWYMKHFCNMVSDDEEVNSIASDKNVKNLMAQFSRTYLKGHPVVMLFENSRLLQILKDNDVRAVQTLDLPSSIEDVHRLTAELSLQESHTKIPDMSDSVLTGRLGEICHGRMRPFALAYAWPAIVTVAGALMPEDTVNRTNLFCASVGQPKTGKSQAIEWAIKTLGARKPILLAEKFGSAEGLASRIGNAGTARRLWYPGELAHTLKKANIEGASFDTILNDAYYSDEQNLTIARQKLIPFSCKLTVIGGLVEDRFGELFGAIAGGGLYDRFIFGQCPTGFKFSYRPYDDSLSAEECQPTATHICPDVWEEKDSWIKLKGIDDRVAEHAIRVATICAGFDGRDVLRAADLEPALVFAQYQMRTRILLRPNEGETYEGKLATAFLNYLERYGRPDKEGQPYKWISRRKMYQNTNAYQIGVNIGDNALKGLQAAGEIEQDKLGKEAVVRKLK